MNKQIQTQLITLAASSTSTNGPERRPVNPSAAVASFIAARHGLQQRQSELEAELAEIQRMLNGDDNGPVPVKTAMPMPPPAPPAVPTTPSEPRRSNGGLRKAVSDLLASGPLTKDQIIEKLLAQKFEFFGKPRPALESDPLQQKDSAQRQAVRIGGGPMKNNHNWSAAYESSCRYLQNEEIDPSPHLFCLEHDHNDGCLLLLGKNQKPMYVVMVSLGPLENATLGQFVDRVAADFIWTRCEGRRGLDEPWCVFGALPAARSLPKAERDRLEKSFALITIKVKQRFHRMQMNN